MTFSLIFLHLLLRDYGVSRLKWWLVWDYRSLLRRLPIIKNVLERHFLPSWNPLAFLLKQSWAPKDWCFWTVVLEKTLESPLDCKESQPVHPKGNLSWIFIGRTGAEAKTIILWPPDVKNWLTGKDPDAGKDWGQEEKWATGWDGWMVSPTQWTWVSASSGSWWWTGKPDMLQSMGSQRVGHNWVTELN